MTSPLNKQQNNSMLVIDTSYTLEMIRDRGMENSVMCRDLDGFFKHVWTVHPFASLLTSETWAPRYGKPVWHKLGPRHHFVEGKAGRFKWLSFLSPLNFLISQVELIFILCSLVHRENINVIRVGDPLYMGLFGYIITRITGAHLVLRVNAHNENFRKNTGSPVYPRLFRSKRIERAIERFIFRRTAMVAAPNKDNLEFALSSGIRKEIATVFPYGNLLAQEHFEEPCQRRISQALFDELGIIPNQFLLTVGRLQPSKYPEDCLYTLSKLHKRGQKVTLVFAGDGISMATLQSQAHSLGVDNWVIFAGNQSQKNLAQLYAYSAVVLSPVTGRALSEAALGGAAVVAYDLDWQSELIEDNKTGYLIPFRDKDKFADAVEKLILDPSLKLRMGTALRNRIIMTMDIERLNEHERREYQRVLGLT